MKTRLGKQLAVLNQGLVEREEAIKVALLAALAGEHVLLLGPPGTAKSLLARRIARLFGDDYFEYLLTKFTTPDELFGPLSLSALKADRFERKVQGYLPTARIAFLDEIFKANSSILNALLALLNERVFHNGEKRLSAPLQALIAASNELPEDDEALAALYDRFLLRLHVGGVSDAALPRLFEESDEPALAPLPLTEVDALRERARRVTLPEEVGAALKAIWLAHREAFKEDARERLSDRRLKKVLWLIKVSAASNDRDAADLSDLMVLRHCLWNHPANAQRVRELVLAAVLDAAGRLAPAEDGAEASSADAPVTPLGKVFKDYAGRGTLEDPLLIRDLHDLVGLERPEIGRQGLCFRLEADIDMSSLTTWPEIHFEGTLDGNGHTVKFHRVDKPATGGLFGVLANSFLPEMVRYLFKTLDQSHVFGLKLDGLGLAEQASQSTVAGCAITTDHRFADTATGCRIERSRSAGGICEVAADCVISDCLLTLDKQRTGGVVKVDDPGTGGVATVLEKNSKVQRCFVTGCQQGWRSFSGIASVVDASLIQSCALGHIKSVGSSDKPPIWRGRIAGEVKNGGVVADDNIALDTLPTTPGIDGKSVAAALFTQRYFEHTLGWDFRNVWEWDAQENRPTLRQVGVAAAGAVRSRQPQASPRGVLATLLAANLWA